jgi:hypothetical protein
MAVVYRLNAKLWKEDVNRIVEGRKRIAEYFNLRAPYTPDGRRDYNALHEAQLKLKADMGLDKYDVVSNDTFSKKLTLLYSIRAHSRAHIHRRRAFLSWDQALDQVAAYEGKGSGLLKEYPESGHKLEELGLDDQARYIGTAYMKYLDNTPRVPYEKKLADVKVSVEV